MKHYSTDAFNKFEQENPTTFDAQILHNPEHLEFLKNRLHRAFMVGLEVGEKHERERIAGRLKDLIS